MSWDKKIMVVMGLFMAFIIGMGIVMITRTESAEDNYYEKDLVFEKDLQAKKNAIRLDISPTIQFDNVSKNITFDFSKMKKNNNIEAKIHFQKPNDTNKNFEIPLQMDAKLLQIIPTKTLEKGVWNIWIEGKIDGNTIKTISQKIEIQ
jgi:hypothetical protein